MSLSCHWSHGRVYLMIVVHCSHYNHIASFNLYCCWSVQLSTSCYLNCLSWTHTSHYWINGHQKLREVQSLSSSNLGASSHCFGFVSTLLVSILSLVSVILCNWHSEEAKTKYKFQCSNPYQDIPDLFLQSIIITSFTIATFPAASILPSLQRDRWTLQKN